MHCSREDLAGAISANNAGLFAHRMHGPCKCGETHNASVSEFKPRSRSGGFLGPIVETYDYVSASGELLFQVTRHEPKTFRQRRPDGRGGWIPSTEGVDRVLYRQLAILDADFDRTIYIVEGERDVHSLEGIGEIATTNPGGAGKWPAVAKHAAKLLIDRDLCIIADRDVNGVGERHAREVAASLEAVARSVRILIPTAPHKDVTDLLSAGGSLADLRALDERDDAPRLDDSKQQTALLSPAARVRALASLGAVVRLPTNIKTLDDSCRGGLPTRRLVVVGGAPGAGKTSLATVWAWQWAKHGIPVGVLAVDEGPEGTIARIAQLEGIAPERIEERDPSALEQLATVLDASALILADGEDSAGSVEALGELVARATESTKGVGVLIVDSIQTVRAAGTDAVDSPRERVDAVVRALKSVRDRFGLLVIATCELARGAYRSRNLAEAINDLAAFKESGSVEYAAQTALVLRSVPDEATLVDVTVPKNRAYRREPFRLRMDHATTRLDEVEMPAEATGGPSRRPVDTLLRDATELRKLLVLAPGINGARAVRTALRARHVAMSNDRVGAALEFLRSRGEIVNRGSERRPALHLQIAQTAEVESDE